MAKTLFGFTKPVYTKGNRIVEIKRMADNYVKTNTDESGVVSDPNVYQEAISLLLPYSDDLTVANKIADLKNSIEKLNSKIEKAEKDLTIFESEYQRGLIDTIQENYSDPMDLFESLALYYSGALDKYDEKIIGGSLEELPPGVDIPQSVLSFREDLNRKSREIVNLSNSYFFEDPEAELPGPAQPDAYGVFVQTNPQTGAIVNIDVGVVDSVSETRKGFAMTDSRYGRLPIYLNTFSSGKDRKGRIGEAGYEWDSDDNVLKIERGALEGVIGGVERIFGALGEETMKGIQQEQQEVPLGSVPFDYFQIPEESVVRDAKNNYYWYGADGNLWKAKDANTLKQYLSEIHKDSSQVDNQAFIGHPDFISSKFMTQEDGTQRTIDEETLGTFGPQRQVSPTPVAEVGKGFPAFPDIRAGTTKTTTPAVMGQSPEYSRGVGQYDVKKIVGKGEEIFKPAPTV